VAVTDADMGLPAADTSANVALETPPADAASSEPTA